MNLPGKRYQTEVKIIPIARENPNIFLRSYDDDDDDDDNNNDDNVYLYLTTYFACNFLLLS